jgi:hypothetical protein
MSCYNLERPNSAIAFSQDSVSNNFALPDAFPAEPRSRSEQFSKSHIGKISFGTAQSVHLVDSRASYGIFQPDRRISLRRSLIKKSQGWCPRARLLFHKPRPRQYLRIYVLIDSPTVFHSFNLHVNRHRTFTRKSKQETNNHNMPQQASSLMASN